MNQWADARRAGFYFDLGPKISSIYEQQGNVGGADLSDRIIDEVDLIVGAMQIEIRNSIIRYYLDPVPGKKNIFFRRNQRTIEMKARTEKITVNQLNTNLRIGRHIVFNQLSRQGLA
ncbi:MAG: hypothetical protein ACE5HI_07425 [bacterium]